MKRAHIRDAILNQKFWFKKNCIRDKNNFTKNNLGDYDYKYSKKEQKDVLE
jgi:hypothetical protein